jgi:hypothetical protein
MNKLRQFFRQLRDLRQRVTEWMWETWDAHETARALISRVSGGLLLLGIVAGLVVAVQVYPEWQVKRASVRSTVVKPEANTTPAEIAGLQNEMRKTFVQEAGGAFALIAVYFTYRRLRVAEQGHITDRYTAAIGQLGAVTSENKSNIEVRLGAVYALERIAFDSPRDHWPIMEVLTAYVRQNVPAPTQIEQGTEAENKKPEKKVAKEPGTEIQAILTVLGRRKRGHRREGKNRSLDLSYTDLEGARFVGAHLVATNFEGAHLDNAKFDRAHLDGALFVLAHLDWVWFPGAHLNGAKFVGAHLVATNFEGARLDRAQFNSTTLTNLYFRNAHLTNAYFSNATITGTSFFGANLLGADFLGADFRDALGLAVERFANAKGVELAQFDDAFRGELNSAKVAAAKSAATSYETPQEEQPTVAPLEDPSAGVE